MFSLFSFMLVKNPAAAFWTSCSLLMLDWVKINTMNCSSLNKMKLNVFQDNLQIKVQFNFIYIEQKLS